ncbi:MAG: hypothetical protein H0W73_13055 [Bacteroidetes bacterium]|nr:hypothetical protein [Bacteroidota bacterium]
MRFITFVKQNSDQQDPKLKSFANYVAKSKKFSLSSDPRLLALQLYDKLNAEQTAGFQLFMILYWQSELKNLLSKDLKDNQTEFLNAINLIIYFQQNGIPDL